MTGNSDLNKRLRSLSRYEHDDLSIGDEAADAVEAAERVLEFYASIETLEQDGAWMMGKNSVGLACRWPTEALHQDQGWKARDWLARHATGQQKGVNTSDDECRENSPVSVQDPMVLLEMLLRFGKSPDGAVESDLRRAIVALKARAARYDQLRAALQRLLFAAEDHEDDEFVADACEDARKALNPGETAEPHPNCEEQS